MKRPKILIICPKFFPIADGLGHHTTQIYTSLKNKGFDINILTSADETIVKSNKHNHEVYPSVKKWNFINLIKQVQLINIIKPTTIYFQYEPFMYQRRGGINFSIIFFIIYLRFIKKLNIHTMFHELYHPFEWTFKTAIMFICHHLMFVMTSLSSNKIFCSTENNFKIIKSCLFNLKKNIYLQYVGANINYIPLENKSSLLDKLKIKEDEIILGLFGTFHESKNIVQTLKIISNINRPVKILYIGATKEEILKNIPIESQDKISNILIGTGFLDDKNCSYHFQIIDLLICYFVDGLSTRRGSAIMGLSHSCPIISTRSPETEEIFKNQESITLLSVDDFELELTNLLEKLDIKKYKNKSETKALDFYNKNFSWDSILKKYIPHIK